MTQGKSCLIVEDDRIIAQHFRMMAARIGLEVCGVVHGWRAAIENAIEHQPDFIFMDVQLRDTKDGVYAAEEIADKAPNSRVIFLTAYSDQLTQERMRAQSPRTILIKPITEHDLKEAVGL